MEHQGLLVLYRNGEEQLHTLHEHCVTSTMQKAANIIHKRTRKKLNTDLKFYIWVIDETESNSKYYECTIDNNTYITKKIKGSCMREYFKSDNNVMKDINEKICNLLDNNKNELIDELTEMINKKNQDDN